MSLSEPSPQNFLFTIENSSALIPYWAEIRDCYLPRLVEQLSGAQAVDSAHIFVSPSRPTFEDSGTSAVKQYNSLEAALSECQFNYDPDNRLAVSQIQAGIEFLSHIPTSQARHLVVVAATPPQDLGFDNDHPWNELVRLFTEEDVYLHLALTSDLRSGRLPMLFEQTLKWQQRTEEPLWLQKYSTALIFRVTALQSYPDSFQIAPEAKQSFSASKAPKDIAASDVYTTKVLEDTPPQSPSIVAQLQQVHGLTKKRAYGSKPARAPFILDEPVARIREPYRKLTRQSSSASLTEMSPPPGLRKSSRSRSNLRADRAFSSRPHVQRLVDPYSVGPSQSHWQQQQQMASPIEDYGSPYHSSALSSPVSPIAHDHISASSESYHHAHALALGVDHSMVPPAFDYGWANNPYSSPNSAYAYASLLPPEYASYPSVDANSPPPHETRFSSPFQSIPTPCELIMSESPAFNSAGASFGAGSSSSASSYAAQAAADFTPPSHELGFDAHHGSYEDYPIDNRDQTSSGHGFPTDMAAPPPGSTTTHIHAPAPSRCLTLPTTQMDMLASVAAASPRLQAPSGSSSLSMSTIFPPSSFTHNTSTTATHSFDGPRMTLTEDPFNSMQHHRHQSPQMTTPSQSRHSSSSPADATPKANFYSDFGASSSSSLTGWAG
ncbi:hypothetical protein R3P38DRAFT_922860 [Favolaschia claudopus]|uniref:Mediator of RNA polymerase II transcription subunit 25 n=1 Tax=Favolaschia claudopus TaxID=2862362 RepID=A0AAW0BP88_9AGAR